MNPWRKASSLLQSVFQRLQHIPALGPALRITRDGLEGFFRDDCLVMAAAVSFYAVLSLIPFVLLVLAVAGFLLERAGQGAEGAALFEQVEAAARAALPFLQQDLLEQVRGLASNRGAFGLTGTFFLFLTAGLLFRSLELAFGRIFRAARRRSLFRSQALLLQLVFSLGLVLLAVHYLGVLALGWSTARDADFTRGVRQFLGGHVWLRLAATFLVAGGVFSLLTAYFSQRRLRWKALLSGGMLFSLLWMLAVRLFGLYLEKVARFSLLYGSLATLAVVVVWIFYSAAILLFCAELCSALQQRLEKDRAQQEGQVTGAG